MYNRIAVNPNSKQICNVILCAIVSAELIACVNGLRTLNDKKEHINSVILLSIATVKFLTHVVLRINFWIFKFELATLINQTLHIIATWGKVNNYI